eukprot:g8259.t1
MDRFTFFTLLAIPIAALLWQNNAYLVEGLGTILFWVPSFQAFTAPITHMLELVLALALEQGWQAWRFIGSWPAAYLLAFAHSCRVEIAERDKKVKRLEDKNQIKDGNIISLRLTATTSRLQIEAQYNQETRLLEEIAGLHADLRAGEEEKGSLRQQIENLGEQARMNNEQLRFLQGDLDEEKRTVDRLADELEDQTNITRGMDAELEKKDHEARLLRLQASADQAQAACLADQLSFNSAKEEERASAAQQLLDTLQDQMQDLKERLDTADKEKVSFRIQLETSREEARAANEKLSVLQGESQRRLCRWTARLEKERDRNLLQRMHDELESRKNGVLLLDHRAAAYHDEIDPLMAALEVVNEKTMALFLLLNTSATEADAPLEDTERLLACLDAEQERAPAAGLLWDSCVWDASALRAENRKLAVQLDKDREDKASLRLQIEVLSAEARAAEEQRISLQGELDLNAKKIARQMELIVQQGNINLDLKKALENSHKAIARKDIGLPESTSVGTSTHTGVVLDTSSPAQGKTTFNFAGSVLPGATSVMASPNVCPYPGEGHITTGDNGSKVATPEQVSAIPMTSCSVIAQDGIDLGMTAPTTSPSAQIGLDIQDNNTKIEEKTFTAVASASTSQQRRLPLLDDATISSPCNNEQQEPELVVATISGGTSAQPTCADIEDFVLDAQTSNMIDHQNFIVVGNGRLVAKARNSNSCSSISTLPQTLSGGRSNDGGSNSVQSLRVALPEAHSAAMPKVTANPHRRAMTRTWAKSLREAGMALGKPRDRDIASPVSGGGNNDGSGSSLQPLRAAVPKARWTPLPAVRVTVNPDRRAKTREMRRAAKKAARAFEKTPDCDTCRMPVGHAEVQEILD